MTKLNTLKLSAMAEDLSTFITEENIKGLEMKILVDEESFRKIDEDLFYRLEKDGEFIPSENEIMVSFHNVMFKIGVA